MVCSKRLKIFFCKSTDTKLSYNEINPMLYLLFILYFSTSFKKIKCKCLLTQRFHLSFLVNKFHDNWKLAHDIFLKFWGFLAVFHLFSPKISLMYINHAPSVNSLLYLITQNLVGQKWLSPPPPRTQGLFPLEARGENFWAPSECRKAKNGPGYEVELT